jgi:arylsulfatase A-like enzyme
VRAKLRELGLDRNTVLIYTSDNGGQFMRENLTTDGNVWDTLNLPLSGWKATLDEGGIRVPFLVEGPGIAPNSVSTVPVGGSDILPTIADLAGVAPADDVDGGSLLPVLRNGGQGKVRRVNAPGLVWHQPWRNHAPLYPASSALRIGDWKYLRKWNEPSGHLYNVAADYREQHDLAGKHQRRATTMQAALDDYLEKVNAEPALPERWGARLLEKQGRPVDPIPMDRE